MPGHYHNGGIWWIWLGWYSVALNQLNRFKESSKLRVLINKVFEVFDDFNFCEYLTPENKEGGQGNMCFTAAGLLMINKNSNNFQ